MFSNLTANSLIPFTFCLLKPHLLSLPGRNLFIFLGLIGISNGFANVLGSSTWAEIYGVKYIGSIKALTTALMVFATAFGTALFGYLIDRDFSIEQIGMISAIYISISLISLFFIRGKLNPILSN